MLLWNHSYMAMEPFRQGILAFDETRGLQDAIPLTTTIQALGREALGTRYICCSQTGSRAIQTYIHDTII